MNINNSNHGKSPSSFFSNSVNLACCLEPSDPNSLPNKAGPPLPSNQSCTFLLVELRKLLICAAVCALITPAVCKPLTTRFPEPLSTEAACFTAPTLILDQAQLIQLAMALNTLMLTAVSLVNIFESTPENVVPVAVATA